MARAEAKERNRRALLDAARGVVAQDGYRARLDDIAARADLTTGAVYSLFGSKNGLMSALVADHLGPHYAGIEQVVVADLSLTDAVDAFARYYRRVCEDPDALRHLSFEISLLDLALRDPALREALAAALRVHEERLTALFAGRAHRGTIVSAGQARRLAIALRALLVGLGQGLLLGPADVASEQYFADAARALTAPEVLGPVLGPE
ncbi:TetR family transcriptional regulator [Streptomyces sp. SID5474]|nr:TetR family transcriptional regulator [Streptomyces sp. SID5474]